MRVRLERAELTLTEPLIVRGTVRLRVASPVYVRRLAVEAIVHTRLDEPDAEGDRFEERAAEVDVFDGLLEPERDEHPFELCVPAAPCTLSALGAHMTYEIRASAVFDHEDRRSVASAALRVDPATHLGDLRISRHHPTTRGLAGTVLGAGAVLLGALGARMLLASEHSNEPDRILAAIAVGLIVIGAGVAAHQLRRFLRERALGAHRLRIAPLDGYRHADGRQLVRIELPPRAGAVSAILSATARRTRYEAVGSGSDRSLVERVSTDSLCRISAHAHSTPDGRMAIDVPLPATAPPPSFDGPRLSVEWSLRLIYEGSGALDPIPLVALPPPAE